MPLFVSSITYSSSGGDTQTAFGILRAYSVSCGTVALKPEDEKVLLETHRGL
jgi:hypothetical protein